MDAVRQWQVRPGIRGASEELGEVSKQREAKSSAEVRIKKRRMQQGVWDKKKRFV